MINNNHVQRARDLTAFSQGGYVLNIHMFLHCGLSYDRSGKLFQFSTNSFAPNGRSVMSEGGNLQILY